MNKKADPTMQKQRTNTAAMTSEIGRGTEKLYYADAYMKEFDAVVLSCRLLETDGAEPAAARYAVILDKTAFFPEEGGQSPDRGTLTQTDPGQSSDTGSHGRTCGQASGKESNSRTCGRVLDVQIRDGIITHTTDLPFSAGSVVHGVLDFAHRFSNMQQHSAEHLFSGLVWSRLGLSNVGFHLSDHEVTMDYSGPISPEEASALELEVNRAIWSNFASRQEFPDAEELKTYEYRSKAEIEGQVRLVVFPGYDICACCAPHVARTGEIGLFRIVSLQSHRGGVRIHMLAGERAFHYLIQQDTILTEVSRSLSTSADLVAERIAGLRETLSGTKHTLSEAKLTLLLKEADSLPASQPDVCLFTDDLEEPVLREAVNQLMQVHGGTCAVFNGNDVSGYRYVIGSHDDVRAVQQRLKDILQARGGGKPPMIQGQVRAPRSEIEKIMFA